MPISSVRRWIVLNRCAPIHHQKSYIEDRVVWFTAELLNSAANNVDPQTSKTLRRDFTDLGRLESYLNCELQFTPCRTYELAPATHTDEHYELFEQVCRKFDVPSAVRDYDETLAAAMKCYNERCSGYPFETIGNPKILCLTSSDLALLRIVLSEGEDFATVEQLEEYAMAVIERKISLMLYRFTDGRNEIVDTAISLQPSGAEESDVD